MKARIERGWKGRIAVAGVDGGGAGVGGGGVDRRLRRGAGLLAAGEEGDQVRLSPRAARNQRPSPASAISPAAVRRSFIAATPRGLALAIGWPASRKRGGGGPPHWLIAPKPPGQRFAS